MTYWGIYHDGVDLWVKTPDGIIFYTPSRGHALAQLHQFQKEDTLWKAKEWHVRNFTDWTDYPKPIEFNYSVTKDLKKPVFPPNQNIKDGEIPKN